MEATPEALGIVLLNSHGNLVRRCEGQHTGVALFFEGLSGCFSLWRGGSLCEASRIEACSPESIDRDGQILSAQAGPLLLSFHSSCLGRWCSFRATKYAGAQRATIIASAGNDVVDRDADRIDVLGELPRIIHASAIGPLGRAFAAFARLLAVPGLSAGI